MAGLVVLLATLFLNHTHFYRQLVCCVNLSAWWEAKLYEEQPAQDGRCRIPALEMNGQFHLHLTELDMERTDWVLNFNLSSCLSLYIYIILYMCTYVHIYIDMITIDYMWICDFTYILYIQIFPVEISELRSFRRSCEVRQVPSRDPCARWLVTARSCRCRCGDGWINAMENMGSLMESGVWINGIIFFLFWSLVFFNDSHSFEM